MLIKKFIFVFTLIGCIVVNPLWAQQKLNYKGYIKDLRTIDVKSSDSILIRSLIHNRLNFKYKLADGLNINMEVRNRLFYGDLGATPEELVNDFEDQNDYFNLSYNPIKQKDLLFNVMIDRAFVEWQIGDFEIRLGRQRINWGVNLFWNPNDIFNAYSFYDFDYEERPGSDALLLRYYSGMFSSIDLVIKMSDSFEQSTFAGMWKFNKKGYDIQFIAGKIKEDVMMGLGWAGNISNAGFKGEYSYFHPYTNDTVSQIHSLCIGTDYAFSEKFYLNQELMFCSNGKNSLELVDFIEYISSPLSSKNLSPTKFTYAIQPVYNINPKSALIFNTAWYIGENAFYLNPSYSFDIKDNLNLSFIGQFIVSDISGETKFDQALMSLRIKWSF